MFQFVIPTSNRISVSCVSPPLFLLPPSSILQVPAFPFRSTLPRSTRRHSFRRPVTLALRNRGSNNLPYFNRIRHSSPSAPQPSAGNGVPASTSSQSPPSLPPSSVPPKTPTSLSLTFAGIHIKLPGTLILMTVPLLWSTYSICIKYLYCLPWALTPPVFNFIRLFIASLFVLPNLLTSLRNSHTKKNPHTTNAVLLAGTELGFYTCLINVLQGYALRFTPASRGAFLSQLSTIIVPLAAFAIRLEPSLGLNVCLASLFALSGVGLLTSDSTVNPFTWKGDGMLLLSAVFSATYVLRSKIHSPKAKHGPLVALKVSTQALFAMGFLVATSGFLRAGLPNMTSAFAGATPMLIAINLAIVLWAGIFVSVVSTALQMAGQEMVPASEAVIIFSSMPLWASFFAIPLGERFGFRGVIGAALIFISAIMSSWKPSQRKKA